MIYSCRMSDTAEVVEESGEGKSGSREYTDMSYSVCMYVGGGGGGELEFRVAC